GIERLDLAAGGAATVYALFEDHAPEMSGDLGPLRVAYSDREAKLSRQLAEDGLALQRPRGFYLCRTLVMAPRKDTQTLSIADADGRALAEAIVSLRANETYHAWTGVLYAEDAALEAAVDDDDGRPRFFRWPGETNLLPDVEASEPLFRALEKDAPGPAGGDDPLPALLPELPDAPKDRLTPDEERVLEAQIERLRDEDADVREAAQTELRRSAQRARLFLAKRLDRKDPEVRARLLELLRPFKHPFTIDYDGRVLRMHSESCLSPEILEEMVLLRVWVNGKAWLPKDAAVLREAFQMSKICTKDLDMNLTFDTKAMGAKTGDRLSIQALYCPKGCVSQDYGISRDVGPHLMLEDTLSAPAISNVATWKIP
ncbi:MAG: hypothetical protein KIS92_25595, partial [Planctomycetota bacterium]|nr:hypothetical protein [Planctomycetota bacterium]